MGTVILAIVLLLAMSVSGQDLRIHALPVGQGDATIIECPDRGSLVIIDMGSSSSQDRRDNKGFMQMTDIVKYMDEHFPDRQYVDKIFLTHPDIDHYTFIAAINKFVRGTTELYHTHEIEHYDDCWKMGENGELQNRGHNLKDVTEVKSEKIVHIKRVDCSKEKPQEYGICNRQANIYVLASELGDCKCTTDNPDSLVLKLVYGDRTALFVGDIEGKAIGTIVTPWSWCNIQSDVLRLSHHGSTKKHANYVGFLRAVNPVIAFSSSNPCHKTWNHPSCHIAAWFMMERRAEGKPHPYMCRWPNDPVTNEYIIYHNLNFGYGLFSTTIATDEQCNNLVHWTIVITLNIAHVSVHREPFKKQWD